MAALTVWWVPATLAWKVWRCGMPCSLAILAPSIRAPRSVCVCTTSKRAHFVISRARRSELCRMLRWAGSPST